MSAPFANLEVASTSNPNFSNASYGDVMLYPGNKTQAIHIGVDKGVAAELKIAKSNVTVNGSMTTSILSVGGDAFAATSSNYGFPYFNTNIAISDVTNLQSNLNLKFDKAGGTLTGDVFTQCNVFNAKQILANSNDTSNAPAYSWSNDSNTGFYHPSNDTIGVVTNSVERMRVNASGFVGIGKSNPAFTLDVNGDVLTSNVRVTTQVLGNSNDSSNAPSYSWSNDSNTGFYHAANDVIGVVTNGVERMRVDDSNVTVTGQVVCTNSAVSQPGGFMFRNRIINGDMRIDQRSNGAVYSTPTVMTLDRWMSRISSANLRFNLQQVAATGIPSQYAMSITTTAAGTTGDNFWMGHMVEGYNMADFMWGTSNAVPVAVSFWVRSSQTGTYSLSMRNNAITTSYTTPYNITQANTWQYVSMTIPPPPANTTWEYTSNAGMFMRFILSCTAYNSNASTWNSNDGNLAAPGQVQWGNSIGNNFQLSCVQLERGSNATSFEFRPYPVELQLCQRYYERWNKTTTWGMICMGYYDTASSFNCILPYKVEKRGNGVLVWASGVTLTSRLGNTSYLAATLANSYCDTGVAMLQFNVSGGIAGQGGFLTYGNGTWIAIETEL